MISDRNFTPASAKGLTCHVHDCDKPAQRKVEEHIFDDDPYPIRHPFTAYLCLEHFNMIMGLKE